MSQTNVFTIVYTCKLCENSDKIVRKKENFLNISSSMQQDSVYVIVVVYVYIDIVRSFVMNQGCILFL